MINVHIDASQATPKIADAIALLKDGRPLFQRIAAALEAQTEANFAAEGRPPWVPLSRRTIAERTKRARGSTLQILQDRGILAASISSDYGADFALIGAGGAAREYAAIHQFGGTVHHAAHSRQVRLRTDAGGELLRQGTDARKKHLAVFAKDKHKRVKAAWATVDAYDVTIPARPYLPFTGTSASATLQPEAQVAILETIERMLADAIG